VPHAGEPRLQRRGDLGACPGEIAVAAGLGRFAADGSVVFHPPQRPAGGTGVQRASAAPAPTSDTGPQVQRGGGSTATDQGGAPGPVHAGGHPAPGLDRAGLEELAGRLYDPLLSRLRAELWAERERAGLLTQSRW
jgi:hypothetical protein